MMRKLTRSFFNQSTLTVAQDLLGKLLVFKDKKGIITETEAYFGFDDPASHAAGGKTPRSEIMFGKAGFSYVYLIYGMYHCLNVVTEKKEYPAAVLIRGIQLLSESDISEEIDYSGDFECSNSSIISKSKTVGRMIKPNQNLITKSSSLAKSKALPKLDGPGKLCRHLGITKSENALDMTRSQDLYIACIGQSYDCFKTPRIGIKVGQDKLWRFLAKI
jgi:DNA-3-methyladenine glycosylase